MMRSSCVARRSGRPKHRKRRWVWDRECLSPNQASIRYSNAERSNSILSHEEFMADAVPIERLQPCLLDRLTDDEPHKKEESRNARAISHQKYRRGVLRDLEWLFNTSAYLNVPDAEAFSL